MCFLEDEIGNWNLIGLNLAHPQSTKEDFKIDFLYPKSIGVEHFFIKPYLFFTSRIYFVDTHNVAANF